MRQQETIAGIRLAMPVVPATGPGKWWTVVVPEAHAAQALQLLQVMPFEQSTNPGIWDSQPKPAGKLAWQIYAIVFVVLFGTLWLMKIWNSVR